MIKLVSTRESVPHFTVGIGIQGPAHMGNCEFQISERKKEKETGHNKSGNTGTATNADVTSTMRKAHTSSASSDMSTGASGSGSPNAALRRAFSHRYEI